MIGLFGLFLERGISPPTVAEFAWFYSVKGNKNDLGFYYFAKRPTKGLQTITKIRESLGSWKEAYFSPQRSRSRILSVGRVSNLLGLPSN